MAIIACHECGGKVSTTASACPHCGAPVDPDLAKAAQAAEEIDTQESEVPEVTDVSAAPDPVPPPPMPPEPDTQPEPQPEPDHDDPPANDNWYMRQPLWLRMAISFVVLFVMIGGFNIYRDYQRKADSDALIASIAEGREERKATLERAQEALEAAERSGERLDGALASDRSGADRSAGNGARGTIAVSRLIAEDLMGDWGAVPKTVKIEGGSIRTLSDGYTFGRNGGYSGTGLLELTIDESPLFSGRYRVKEKGRMAIRNGRVYWTPREVDVEPLLGASDSRDKRQAMALFAQNLADGALEPSDDEIVAFSRDRWVMRVVLSDGQIVDTTYRRR